MKRSTASRRRPSVQISLVRAARLHRLVTLLAESPRSRDAILMDLRIGLRTFYRELELLRRCGVKIRLDKKAYRLIGTPEEVAGRLPFPDPQLSFAEMAELARGPGEAARRLAALLESVIGQATIPPTSGKRRGHTANARRKLGGRDHGTS